LRGGSTRYARLGFWIRTYRVYGTTEELTAAHAVNLAVGMRRLYGARVLLIDADSDSGFHAALAVQVDGKMVPLGRAKQRTLLAAPARAQPGRRFLAPGRAAMDGKPRETAANNLQVHISKLRSALEPERPPGASSRLLLSQSSGYLLLVRPDQLDLPRFGRLAEEGRTCLSVSRLFRA
jgi:hypothetical protein